MTVNPVPRWRAWSAATLVASLLVGAVCAWPVLAGRNDEPADAAGGTSMERRLARLESLTPNQGEFMSVLGYHFGNLWFALDSGNWPLASYYLDKCRESLARAVAAEPQRKLSNGTTLSIKGIADALDKTQFAQLAQALAARDKDQAARAYRMSMMLCMSCHAAAERPFLRVQIPKSPPASVIVFEAAGKAP